MKYYLDDDESIQPTSKVESKMTTTSPSGPAKAEEPGWFMPGSKSESAVRGFANAATMGMAPRWSATFRSDNKEEYDQRLKEYIDADKAAAAANPKTSALSSIATSLTGPMGLAKGAGQQIAAGAGLGALSAHGNSSNEGPALAIDMTKGALLGGAVSSVLPLIGSVVGTAKNAFTGTPDMSRIKQALQDFKSAPVPPVDVTGKPEVAGKIAANWQSMQPSAVASRNPGAANANVTVDSAIKHASDVTKLPEQYVPKGAFESAIDVANRGKTPFNAITNSALSGAASGAALGAYGSGGDPYAIVGGALGGAKVGAVGAGKMLNSNGRIRMPTPADSAGTQVPGMIQSGMNAVYQPVLAEEFSTPTSPFSKLSNFLNPKVQEKEQQVAPILESGSPDEKRKAAMQLQGDAPGRAVLNTASRYRYLED